MKRRCLWIALGTIMTLPLVSLLILINTRPERTRIDYSFAWTVVPGTVHVHGLQIRSRRMHVVLAGVGYGWTGLLEVVPGRTTRAPLAPLAPFAVVVGTVPAEAIGGVLTARRERAWERSRVAVGRDGRFRAELPPGAWWLEVSKGGRRVASLALPRLAPGQRLEGVAVALLAPEVPSPSAEAAPEPPTRGDETPWASGVVRDRKGQPVAGATVEVDWQVATPLRMLERSARATTDAQGRYELALPEERWGPPVRVLRVAHVPGRPPAFLWGDGPADLVIPDRGGVLEVKVVRDGAPVAGVAVGARQEGALAPRLPSPVRTTDAAGVARFEALLPGRYQVRAVVGGEGRDLFERGSIGAQGTATGLAVAVGATTHHRLAISPQPAPARVQVLHPDGSSLAGAWLPFEREAVGGDRVSTSVEVGEDGIAELALPSAGLWRVQLQTRDAPIHGTPPDGPPYVSADGVLGMSPWLPQDAAPVALTARRIEPATLEVELVDARGQPARGVVELGFPTLSGDWLPEARLAGSTDAGGKVRFAGLPLSPNDEAEPYVLWAHLSGRPALDLSRADDEALLRGQTAVLAEALVVAPNEEGRVVLREQPVGYVRAVLAPPPGRTSRDYAVSLDEVSSRGGARALYDEDTGAFVAGPLVPGEVGIEIACLDPFRACGVRAVEVVAGQVAHAELRPTPAHRSPASRPSTFGPSPPPSLDTVRDLVGRVRLPEGGPALGAVVLYLEPGRAQPVLGGITDAVGAIHATGLWYSSLSRPPADDPPEPLVVALSPGSHGAVVVPAPAASVPLDLTLPRSVDLLGRVRVAGQVPADHAGSLRVLASYEGPDKAYVGSLLSVEATAQADGAFELAGLTPGVYRVQAALDDLWLSPAVDLVVSDRDPMPVMLSIPAPGGPAWISVVDSSGAPVPGRAVVVERPAGPLTERLWPTSFLTDGAGAVYLPALEAGRHIVRSGSATVEVEVQALTGGPEVRAAPSFPLVLPVR
jgi:hypothetical protein